MKCNKNIIIRYNSILLFWGKLLTLHPEISFKIHDSGFKLSRNHLKPKILLLMKTNSIIIALFALALSACGGKKSTAVEVESEVTQAQALLTRIDTLRQHGYMFAHQDDPFYGVTWQWDRNGRSDTKELVGDYPAVFGFDLGGIEMGDMKNLDSVPFEWIREEAIKHVERGGIVTFSWHPRNPRTGETAWDVSDVEVVKNILPDGEQHETFCEWMNKLTTFLETLKTADGEPIPFIFRPFHEYDGSWFWWGEKFSSPEEFLAMWNMLQDHVRATLPDNIVWAFSPNLHGGWTEEAFLQKYPGDDRVDMLGVDAYQWGTEEQFVTGLRDDLAFIQSFADKHGKPFALTECGYQNSPDPTWWTRVLKPIMDDFKISYFLPWRNWHKEHFGPSKDLCTADDFIRLYEAPNTLFLNDIAK